jgi:hypothetical protein
LRQWGLGPFLFIAAFLVVMWFWRRCVILGKPVEPGRDHRIEAIEGVDALAGLYLRSMSRHDLGELFQQRLVREITLRTGKKIKAARKQAQELTNGLSISRAEKLSEHEFQNVLRNINQAFRSIRDEHRRRRP